MLTTPFPVPPGEAARLAALHRYEVLDAPTEEGWDRIVSLAAEALGAEAAMLTLVDEGRRVVAASSAGERGSAPRAGSFCAHAVAGGGVFVVEDASRDPRFRSSPHVAGAPGLRFYAGAPLLTPEGHAIGALCVVGVEPRALTPREERVLTGLAAVAMGELERRRELRLRASAEASARGALACAYGTLDSISDGLYAFDHEWRFTYVNARAEKAFGRVTTELAGEVLWEAVPEVLGTPFEEGYRRAVATGQPVAFEAFWAPHDAWYGVRAYPHDHGLTVFLTDVTERRGAQAALAESESRHRQLVEGLNEVVFEIDTEGRCAFANPAWARLSGRPPSDAVGTPFLAAFHPEDRAVVEDVLRRTLAGEPAGWRPIARLQGSGGGVRAVEVQLRPVHDAHGVTGATGVLYDLTDARRARAEQQARQEAEAARQEAEALLRTKASLLDTIGHELRTPLAGILGFADLIVMEGNQDQAEFAQFIGQSGRRLLDTLNAILDLARLEGGGFELAPAWQDLPGLLWEATAPWQTEAEGRGLSFEVDVEPGLEEAFLDAEGVRRVVGHLAANAVRFTEAGGVRVEVARAPGGARFRVADTGRGIDPDFLPSLFEPFRQQSEGLQRTHEGCGIGLTVTRRLVELMGGEISVSSEPGAGTTFAVTLPCRVRGEAGGEGDGALYSARVGVADGLHSPLA